MRSEFLITYGEEFIEKPNSSKEWPCELALLALGFSVPEPSLSSQLKLELDENSNIKSNKNYQTNNILHSLFKAKNNLRD